MRSNAQLNLDRSISSFEPCWYCCCSLTSCVLVVGFWTERRSFTTQMNTRVLASNQEQACADCCSALAEALPHFLQELHVGFTLCGASGLAALLPRLTALPSLSVLRCEGNALGLEGMQLLAEALPQMARLEELWVNHNQRVLRG